MIETRYILNEDTGNICFEGLYKVKNKKELKLIRIIDLNKLGKAKVWSLNVDDICEEIEILLKERGDEDD